MVEIILYTMIEIAELAESSWAKFSKVVVPTSISIELLIASGIDVAESIVEIVV